ncbi:MAG: GNAT family N-acetyltransferase [Candidatus Eisenbacteria bacterium]|uniref:GNAT family N-acetyltransferase n=1 Tax=Eiseniibacteriota bacterium TaxID=2212470 RepID=A0A948W7C0_UNCEI|nr:GNAT family N-acetyltransferase [Candidatus Eisenbacteria bacterium]MBU1950581.1 GNAT family N-acetyltransferase [Candidatus Eisenbacteria bacterium]MBU2692439.1 GNAT family N-acetyltransferase [Candidatus Eisenbacteria bacterium]
MLIGGKVRLRKVEREDLCFLFDLLNDTGLQNYDVSMHAAISRYALDRDFEKLFHRQGWERFLITSHDGQDKYGIISVKEIKGVPNCYTLSIALTTRNTGCGYGSEAIQLLLGFMFRNRAAVRIGLEVRSYNTRAIHCFAGCGFIREGTLRQASFHDGAYCDVLVMSILRTEFMEKQQGKSQGQDSSSQHKC